MFSNRDLDVGVRGNTQKALSNRDGLLFRIEPDLEHLLGALELTDHSLELALLLFALARSRAQLSATLDALVHERRIRLSDSDHRILTSWPGSNMLTPSAALVPNIPPPATFREDSLFGSDSVPARAPGKSASGAAKYSFSNRDIRAGVHFGRSVFLFSSLPSCAGRSTTLPGGHQARASGPSPRHSGHARLDFENELVCGAGCQMASARGLSVPTLGAVAAARRSIS